MSDQSLSVGDTSGAGVWGKVFWILSVSESHPLESSFKTGRMDNALSSTPPSLYLFREGGEFWIQAEESKGKRINHDLVIQMLNASKLFGKMDETVKCVYMEYLRIGDEEYSRDVFLAG